MAIIIEYFFIICYNNNMFNWFKNKVELKNDNSIMSSFYNKRGLKLGSELIVPTNFKALIYYNEKLYYTLNAGKHKVDISNMANLINAHKTRKKVKNVKLVCHYINTSPQTLELNVKKQKYLVNFCIDNIEKFAEFMLLYSYKVDNDYVFCNLHDMFCELLAHNNGNCNNINKTSLINYGIIIESFANANQKASIFNQQNDINNQIQQPTGQETAQPISQSQTNTPPQHENTDAQASNKSEVVNNTQICPNCKNISKFNTAYCLKCGHKLQ